MRITRYRCDAQDYIKEDKNGKFVLSVDHDNEIMRLQSALNIALDQLRYSGSGDTISEIHDILTK